MSQFIRHSKVEIDRPFWRAMSRRRSTDTAVLRADWVCVAADVHEGKLVWRVGMIVFEPPDYRAEVVFADDAEMGTFATYSGSASLEEVLADVDERFPLPAWTAKAYELGLLDAKARRAAEEAEVV